MTITDTIEERTKDFRNYVAAVQAVEDSMRLEVHKKVKAITVRAPGELPDYSKIKETEAHMQAVRDIVDEAYSFDNELHPFHGVVSRSGNFYTDGLLEDVLFPHAGAVKASVGEDRFSEAVRSIAQKSQKELEQKLIGKAATDIVANESLGNLTQYLKDTYSDINTTVVDAVTEKPKLITAYMLEMLRVMEMSREINARKIEDAILGKEV